MTAPAARIVNSEPMLYRASRWLTQSGMRGGSFLLNVAQRTGALRVVMNQRVDGLEVEVPLWLTPEWTARYIADYHTEAVEDFAAHLKAVSARDAIFIDCGAHIGVIALKLMAAHGQHLAEVVAFEPNETLAGILSRNLGRMDVAHRCFAAALGEAPGRGHLTSPEIDQSPEAKFMVTDPDGEIEITSIDHQQLPAGRDLLIKVDVEGAELDVLRGARETLEQARSFMVIAEAHPNVVHRTGVDPVETLEFLHSIRPCDAYVCGEPELRINPTSAFYDQLGGRRKCDFVVVSR